MNTDRGAVLRALRGDRSLRGFAEHLAAHTSTSMPISRHRLGRLEDGSSDLSGLLWDELADTLIRGGHSPSEVAPLRSGGNDIEPVPPSTPGSRRAQWVRITANVEDNRSLGNPKALLRRVYAVERAASYWAMAQRSGIDVHAYRQAVQDRIAKGEQGSYHREPGDAVEIDAANSVLDATAGSVDLVLMSARLCNTGTVAWQDRLLYRLGPTVTSSLPFTPGVLLVPDTPPGGRCDIRIPVRAQFFPNLAVVSYVMVYPDFSACLPGCLRLHVDTRSGEYDHTFALPSGFGNKRNDQPKPL